MDSIRGEVPSAPIGTLGYFRWTKADGDNYQVKRIVLITTKYPDQIGHEWLTNELADKMSERDVSVSVVVLSWEFNDGETGCSRKNNVVIHRLRLWKFLYKKHVFCAFLKLALFSIFGVLFFRHLIKSADLIVATTPCAATWALLLKSLNRKARRYLIVWDFFPYYVEGFFKKLPNSAFQLMVYFEGCLYRQFNDAGCMTTSAMHFMATKYEVSGLKIGLLPLWTKQHPHSQVSASEKAHIRRNFSIPSESFVCVYGGAMTRVQDLDKLVDLALCAIDNPAFHFVFIGAGPDLIRLKSRVSNEGIKNVTFLPFLSRSDYGKLISACDLGLISLSSRHSVPSFPSKTIDYLRFGLPILATIDNSTDYGDILVKDIKAGLYVDTSSAIDLYAALSFLRSSPDALAEYSSNGRRYYDENLNVDYAACTVLQECDAHVP